MVFPILYTKRLKLRQLEDTDHKEIFALRSNDEINKYISRIKATSIDEAQEFIKKINAGIAENKNLYWAICFNDSKKLIGAIGLWNFSEDRTVGEIGYELNPTYQKMGIMSETLQSVINYGFIEFGLKKIFAYTHKDNRSSSGLLEKNNFKIDELVKDDEDMNNVVYSLTEKSYNEARANYF